MNGPDKYELFCASALSGLLANNSITPAAAASLAVAYADALTLELGKRPHKEALSRSQGSAEALESAGAAYTYAHDIIKGRFPEGEPVIVKDAMWAFRYARDVIKGCWPEAEPAIVKGTYWACLYACDVIKGRWPQAEPEIAKDAELAYFYAKGAIKGPWPEAEPAIAKDAYWGALYAIHIIKGPWPKAEEKESEESMIKTKLSKEALKSPEAAYCYALTVLNGRFPEAEPVIAKTLSGPTGTPATWLGAAGLRRSP